MGGVAQTAITAPRNPGKPDTTRAMIAQLKVAFAQSWWATATFSR